MEAVIIALICAASFGTVVAISVFIRQLLLSRDKQLNDEAQRKAIEQEAGELEKLREQMQSNKRFDSHYKVLGANKDAIAYLDNKIEDILQKKTRLIERYSQLSIKESTAIVNGDSSPDRKQTFDRLKQEIDEEIKFYDNELSQIQKRRTSLWDTHTELENYLVLQEKSRNENLDYIYKRHTGLLEKIYLRHADTSEHIAKESIDAGTTSFKSMILAPIQFLLQYFNLSTGISSGQSQIEQAARDNVREIEDEVNQSGHSDGDTNHQDKVNKKDEQNPEDPHSKEKTISVGEPQSDLEADEDPSLLIA